MIRKDYKRLFVYLGVMVGAVFAAIFLWYLPLQRDVAANR